MVICSDWMKGKTCVLAWTALHVDYCWSLKWQQIPWIKTVKLKTSLLPSPWWIQKRLPVLSLGQTNRVWWREHMHAYTHQGITLRVLHRLGIYPSTHISQGRWASFPLQGRGRRQVLRLEGIDCLCYTHPTLLWALEDVVGGLFLSLIESRCFLVSTKVKDLLLHSINFWWIRPGDRSATATLPTVIVLSHSGQMRS